MPPTRLFFVLAMILNPEVITKFCWLASYDDKRAYNKRTGPGGGTRRLHHKLLFPL